MQPDSFQYVREKFIRFLGFLNLNDKVAANNQDLKDVVLALKWIKKIY